MALLLTHGSAYTRFMPESLQVSIGAARDIQQGEEITISCKLSFYRCPALPLSPQRCYAMGP
jgi:hypothetical protein